MCRRSQEQRHAPRAARRMVYFQAAQRYRTVQSLSGIASQQRRGALRRRNRIRSRGARLQRVAACERVPVQREGPQLSGEEDVVRVHLESRRERDQNRATNKRRV